MLKSESERMTAGKKGEGSTGTGKSLFNVVIT